MPSSSFPAGIGGTLKDNPGEWGAQRIIDFSQNPPTEVGSFRSPRAKLFPPPDGGIYMPRLARMFGDDVALTTWMSDGLRVVDLSNPAAPKEIGSFVPPAAADPSPEAGAGSTNMPPLTTSASLQLKRGPAWPNQTGRTPFIGPPVVRVGGWLGLAA